MSLKAIREREEQEQDGNEGEKMGAKAGFC